MILIFIKTKSCAYKCSQIFWLLIRSFTFCIFFFSEVIEIESLLLNLKQRTKRKLADCDSDVNSQDSWNKDAFFQRVQTFSVSFVKLPQRTILDAYKIMLTKSSIFYVPSPPPPKIKFKNRSFLWCHTSYSCDTILTIPIAIWTTF